MRKEQKWWNFFYEKVRYVVYWIRIEISETVIMKQIS